MDRLVLEPGEVSAGLRLMKTVALADGSLTEKEVVIIEAAARALGQSCDARTVEPITPSESALRLASPLVRERAVQASMLVSMIDGEVSPREVDAIATFAAALGVAEPRIANLNQLARGHVRRMWKRAWLAPLPHHATPPR